MQSWRSIEWRWQALRRLPLLHVPPGHFYSPITSRAEREEVAGQLTGRRRLPAELPGIDLRADAQLELAAELGALATDLPWSDAPEPGLRYRYGNGVFDVADGTVYATMLRRLRPRRLVEVGCGWSSALALDVNDRYLGGATDISFVEPYPEALRSVTRPGDLDGRLRMVRLQDAAPGLFTDLGDGDVLFVDSTHVSKSGSDVNRFFFDVLPSLAPGVVVHVHDVFYPFEYPADWIRSGRCWNEDYLMRTFLQFNDSFEIMFFGSYLQQLHTAALGAVLPPLLDHGAGSIWLRRTR